MDAGILHWAACLTSNLIRGGSESGVWRPHQPISALAAAASLWVRSRRHSSTQRAGSDSLGDRSPQQLPPPPPWACGPPPLPHPGATAPGCGYQDAMSLRHRSWNESVAGNSRGWNRPCSPHGPASDCVPQRSERQRPLGVEGRRSPERSLMYRRAVQQLPAPARSRRERRRPAQMGSD